MEPTTRESVLVLLTLKCVARFSVDENWGLRITNIQYCFPPIDIVTDDKLQTIWRLLSYFPLYNCVKCDLQGFRFHGVWQEYTRFIVLYYNWVIRIRSYNAWLTCTKLLLVDGYLRLQTLCTFPCLHASWYLWRGLTSMLQIASLDLVFLCIMKVIIDVICW